MSDKMTCQKAIDLALEMGASYADARIIKLRKQAISLKNGVVDDCSNRFDMGIGVRVIVNGSWGFAGNPDIRQEKIEICVERSVAMAKAAATVEHDDLVLTKNPVYKDAFYETPKEIDPFEVSLKEKVDYLLKCDAAMAEIPEIKIRKCSMDSWNEEKVFVSSEGSVITQNITHFGAGMTATSIGEQMQTRSFPSSFRGQHSQGGYELLKEFDLLGNARRIAEEARDLQSAPECPSRKMSLILGGSQLALQVHESCGHPVELDRVLGMEANFAGTSFLTTEKQGNYRYGSDLVNIVCDATVPNGLGTFGWDDDGVKAAREYIIKDGIFVGYLSGRDTASMLKNEPNSATRTDGWNNFPMVRMTNINLLPGDTSFEDIIKSTEDGILLTDNNCWSIDDRRLNFQFGSEIGWIIKNGKIDHMVKNPNYTGITPEFWNSCSAVADKDSWKMWGTPNCGKGQPSQTIRVGHGVSFARFDNVSVGV